MSAAAFAFPCLNFSVSFHCNVDLTCVDVKIFSVMEDDVEDGQEVTIRHISGGGFSGQIIDTEVTIGQAPCAIVSVTPAGCLYWRLPVLDILLDTHCRHPLL